MDEKSIALDIVTARFERTISRLWILCIILIIALLGSNGAWIWYESQFESIVTVEQKADWENGDVVLNGTGEVSIYGERVSESN